MPALSLPTTKAADIEGQIDEAVNRLISTAAEDEYESIGILSVRWLSDDTGSKLDSQLLIDTLTTLLHGVIAATYEIPVNETSSEVLKKYCELRESLTGHRKLVIFHYAGHALRGSTTTNLSLTPRIHQPEDELSAGEDFQDFSLIKAPYKRGGFENPWIRYLICHGLLLLGSRRSGRHTGRPDRTHGRHD